MKNNAKESFNAIQGKYVSFYETDREKSGDRDSVNRKKLCKSRETDFNTVSSVMKIFNGTIIKCSQEPDFYYDIVKF